MSNIIEREIINLPEKHISMIKSGWGSGCVDNAVVEKIVYLSDGLKIAGYLAYPRSISPGKKFPCIMWNRGGSKKRGAIDAFTARGIFGLMASWGYVVFASSYRGSIEGEGEEEFGGSDVNDIINLVNSADEIPFADTSKWGIEGWSRGGMMTYLTLKRLPVFRAAVITCGISDLDLTFRANPELRARNYELIKNWDYEKEAAARSAVKFADLLPKSTKYLLIHGNADTVVDVNQTFDLARKFNEYNLFYRMIIFEEGDHFLRNFRAEVDDARKNWFDRFLK